MLNRENLMAKILDAVDSPVCSQFSAKSGSVTDTAEMKYKLEQSRELLLQVGFYIKKHWSYSV
jgi:hypothetical protein